MVEGTIVPLGTPRPSSKPVVSATTTVVPKSISAQLIDDGSMVAGTYYYAVSAVFENGISPPSDIATAAIAAEETKNIKITWNSVTDAIGYIVWGRGNDYAQMKQMIQLDASQSSFTDNGTITPKINTASDYFDKSEVSYVYTYERDVNNVYNESGLSPVSDSIITSNGRIITRNFLTDGFLSQPSSETITDQDHEFSVVERPDGPPNYPYYEELSIKSFSYNEFFKYVTFVCNAEHHLTTGDTVSFVGTDWKDVNYKDKQFTVVVTDSTSFAIKDIPPPQQSISGQLYDGGLRLLNPNDNYLNGITDTFPLNGGFGEDATISITTGDLQYGVASITDWSIVDDGTPFYRVGDLLTAEIPSVTSGAPTEREILSIGDIYQLGSGYGTDGVPASIAIDGMNVGSGYGPSGEFSQEATGSHGTYFTGTILEDGTVSANGLGLLEGAEGSGWALNDTFTFQNPPSGGSGFQGKIASLQPTTYTNIDIIGANGSTASGSGAKATVIVSGTLTVTSVTITDGGSGYVPEELLTIDLPTTLNEYQFYPNLSSNTTGAVFEVTDIISDYKVAIGRSRISITPELQNLQDGDIIYLNMKDSGEGGINRVAFNYAGSGFTGEDVYYDVPLIYAEGFSGNGTGALAKVTVSNGMVSDFVISDDGVGYSVGDRLTIDPSAEPIEDAGNVSSIALTVASVNGANEIKGLFKVYKNDIYGNPIIDGQFDINTVVTDWDNPVALGALAKFTPYNGYYKTWNIYRTGSAGSFQLVSRVGLSTETYTDTTSAAYLGSSPTSYYLDTGIFGTVQIDFDVPPEGLTCLTTHYGMLFGVYGQTVRWTPLNQPDAWPENYYQTFSSTPLALASFGTGLIVLCEDAIYRMDGNQPSSISVSKTMAEDGCIAPYSVQKTTRGLVYLAKRGVMLFDGMNAVCITDSKIPATRLIGPSKAPYPYDFFWLTTKIGYFHSNWASPDTIWSPDTMGNRYNLTSVIPTPNYSIRSFYHFGKYYMFFTGTDAYEAHTTLCIDLQTEEPVITTLGMKPVDVFVDEYEEAFALFSNAGNNQIVQEGSSLDANFWNLRNFKSLESDLQQDPEINVNNEFEPNVGLSIWKLFSGRNNMPMFVRSGQRGFGNVSERKKFSQIEFYGSGTMSVRVFIDGRHIADDIVTLTEAPSQPRKMNLPRGNRTGYNLDFEVMGDTSRLVVEYLYDDMKAPS